jgi:hypothetical protein
MMFEGMASISFLGIRLLSLQIALYVFGLASLLNHTSPAPVRDNTNPDRVNLSSLTCQPFPALCGNFWNQHRSAPVVQHFAHEFSDCSGVFLLPECRLRPARVIVAAHQKCSARGVSDELLNSAVAEIQYGNHAADNVDGPSGKLNGGQLVTFTYSVG